MADAEKIGLIKGLEVNDGAASASTVVKPNFALLASQGEIASHYADILEGLSLSEPDVALQDPKTVDALLSSLSSITRDENAVCWITSTLVEGCKLDTSNWSLVAKDGRGVDATFTSFMRKWNSTSANDGLALVLCNCLNYNQGTVDVRPLFKMIIDSSNKCPMTTEGRLAAISNLLRLDSLRFDLCNSSTLRNVITQGLQGDGTAVAFSNATYYATLCLWQLSFNKKVIAEHEGPLYVHRSMLRAFIAMFNNMFSSSNKKEKIVRASVNTISNLLEEEWLFEIFVQQKIDYILTSYLVYEKFRDEELYKTIEDLQAKFYSKLNQISNFERYIKELDNARFTPGPLHTEKFWLQNYAKFEDNEYDAIKKLSKLLFSTDDLQTLSLAIYDLGEFARLYPTGKSILSNTGAKAKIMDYMNHKNKEISKQALLTTQKLMLDNWKEIN